MTQLTLTEYEGFVDGVWMGKEAQSDNEWEKKYYELRDLFIMTTGLGGETGEALEKIKKFVRDGTVDSEGLKKELGDVLYYTIKLAHKNGWTLQDVIDANVEKLKGRLERGTMKGSGDLR